MKDQFDFIKGSLERLKESFKEMEAYKIKIAGREFIVYPGVFSPKYFSDTSFFASSLDFKSGEKFLEIGCGTGIVAVVAALAGADVSSTDINDLALENTKENAKLHGVLNKVEIVKSDVYDSLDYNSRFDTIFWNVPWLDFKPSSIEEASIFDEGYKSAEKFIMGSQYHLARNGRVLIGFSSTMGALDKIRGFCDSVGMNLRLITSKIFYYGSLMGDVSVELWEARRI